jgi:hypothetical protein
MLNKLTVRNRKIFHLLLAVIYTGFFAVQLFFSFGNSTEQIQTKQSCFVAKALQSFSAKENTFSKKHKDGNGSKPLLNKRFQPKSIEFVPVAIHYLIFDYIDKDQKFSSYQSILLVSFIQHYSLRGPPVVALSV